MASVKVFYVWQSNRSQRCHRRHTREAAWDACQRITLVWPNDFHVTLEEAAVARLLTGTFDCIWRELGLGYSRNYDIEGNWNRQIMA